MGGFRRFCLVIFFIAGALALLGLLAPWYGPYTEQATALMSQQWYWWALLGCAGVTAVGLVCELIRAITARSKKKVVVVSKIDGGTISVTCPAIAAQVRHIVEQDGTCEADKVKVDVARGNRIRVHVRVVPLVADDVSRKGAELHDLLMNDLGAFCGGALDSVSVQFLEARDHNLAERDEDGELVVDGSPNSSDYSGEATYRPSAAETTSAGRTSYANYGLDTSARDGGATVVEDETKSMTSGTGDVTVPMGGEGRS